MHKELLLVTAQVAPLDLLIEKLKEDITNYENALLTDNKEEIDKNLSMLATGTMLVHLNIMMKQSGKSAVDMIKKIDEMEKRGKLFETGGN